MSFALEDDVDRSQSQSQSQATVLRCDECGGTDFYQDEGKQVCRTCFTQSQSQLDNSQLEYEDVMGLAAKTGRGTIVQTKKRKRASAAPQTTKKLDVRELDRSVPFPCLKDCLQGFQAVVKECTRILVIDLLEWDWERYETCLETVQTLWRLYLKSWADGAEYYGTLAPHERFCLRDAFLLPSQRGMILRHLSHQVMQNIRRQETDDPAAVADLEKTTDDENDEESSEEDDLADDSTEAQPSVSRRTVPRSGALTRVLRDNAGPVQGPKEAALGIELSMNMAAALIWLAVARAGVSSRTVSAWIANGSLPLLQSFGCLKQSLQEKLRPIEPFFRMPVPPTPSLLESNATLLLVACGLESWAAWTGDAVIYGKPRLLTTTSVPIVAGQFVADLNLGPNVWKHTMALMGVETTKEAVSQSNADDAPVGKDKGKDKEKPMAVAAPERLPTMAHVVATIAHACQKCPDWRQWSYELSSPRRRSKSKQRRDVLVPWTEDQFRCLVTNGSTNGYLEFLEEQMIDPKQTLAPNFIDQLDVDGIRGNPTGYGSDDDDGRKRRAVRPCRTLIGGSQCPETTAMTLSTTPRSDSSRYQRIESMDTDQRLLMEFLAHHAHLDVAPVMKAYKQLFSKV